MELIVCEEVSSYFLYFMFDIALLSHNDNGNDEKDQSMLIQGPLCTLIISWEMWTQFGC